MWLSTIVISIIGTLAHFLYDFSGHNKIIGLFSAVNESTWEHIKIALTPTILWSLYDGFVDGPNPNYFLAKLTSLLILVLAIPLMFYGYQAITKKDILALDIITFYIAIVLSQLTFSALLNLSAVPYLFQYLSCLGTFIFFGAYTLLTLMPLKNFLFKDPITRKFGFPAHSEKFNPFKKSKKK